MNNPRNESECEYDKKRVLALYTILFTTKGWTSTKPDPLYTEPCHIYLFIQYYSPLKDGH